MPAHLHQHQLGMPSPGRGKHVQKNVDPLARNATSHVEHEWKPLPKFAENGKIVRLVSLRRELRRDSIGCMNQPIRIDQAQLDDAPQRHKGAAEDHGCLLKTGQYPPRHGSKPRGPSFALRIEQTAERIQVVAIHPSAIRRQLMNQMRVAMVANVEAVEIPCTAAHKLGVIPKSIDEAIRVSRCFEITCARQSREAPHHRRANSRGLHVEQPIALKMRPQHFRGQVHARPALLTKVAENG